MPPALQSRPEYEQGYHRTGPRPAEDGPEQRAWDLGREDRERDERLGLWEGVGDGE
jgi:hypothetical protein